ncbi:hypothetical protein GCM10020221_35160 [Streptomyces thioluteus]|uniref:Uncharacterized protein n=1 Tax=Streptomyces thioluteus TaxID=66431 RepID=A0ABN3X3G0_STRTU
MTVPARAGEQHAAARTKGSLRRSRADQRRGSYEWKVVSPAGARAPTRAGPPCGRGSAAPCAEGEDQTRSGPAPPPAPFGDALDERGVFARHEDGDGTSKRPP